MSVWCLNITEVYAPLKVWKATPWLGWTMPWADTRQTMASTCHTETQPLTTTLCAYGSHCVMHCQAQFSAYNAVYIHHRQQNVKLKILTKVNTGVWCINLTCWKCHHHIQVHIVECNEISHQLWIQVEANTQHNVHTVCIHSTGLNSFPEPTSKATLHCFKIM